MCTKLKAVLASCLLNNSAAGGVLFWMTRDFQGTKGMHSTYHRSLQTFWQKRVVSVFPSSWTEKTRVYGRVCKWLKRADCKSVLVRVRWFKSNPSHHISLRVQLYSFPSTKKVNIASCLGKSRCTSSTYLDSFLQSYNLKNLPVEMRKTRLARGRTVDNSLPSNF